MPSTNRRLLLLRPVARPKRAAESGFALVIALLLLVALTIIGVSSIRNVTLQERMAGNLYFRTLAYNETQSALRFAEESAMRDYGGVNSTLGTCSASDPKNLCQLTGGVSPTVLSSDSAWAVANSVATTSNAGFSAAWFSENITGAAKIEDAVSGCSRSLGASSGAAPTLCQSVFMLHTSRAVDGTTGARSIAQQYFRFLGTLNDVR